MPKKGVGRPRLIKGEHFLQLHLKVDINLMAKINQSKVWFKNELFFSVVLI